MFIRRRRAVYAFLGALLLPSLFLTGNAHAIAIILPDVSVQVGPEDSPLNVSAQMLADASHDIVENSNGSVTFVNGTLTMEGEWQWHWDSLTVKLDPFVSSVFGFTNMSAIPQIFVVSVSIPVAPLGPSTLMGGSMVGGVTDANFDGLGGVATVVPTALYTGTIDGLPVLAAQLHPHPFATAPFSFPGDSQPIPNVSFGLPGPTAPGPAVFSTIGINNRFSLSPGDIVSMTNFFVVTQAPEPSSLVLALLGAVGLAWQVRRRRAG